MNAKFLENGSEILFEWFTFEFTNPTFLAIEECWYGKPCSLNYARTPRRAPAGNALVIRLFDESTSVNPEHAQTSSLLNTRPTIP